MDSVLTKSDLEHISVGFGFDSFVSALGLNMIWAPLWASFRIDLGSDSFEPDLGPI